MPTPNPRQSRSTPAVAQIAPGPGAVVSSSPVQVGNPFSLSETTGATLPFSHYSWLFRTHLVKMVSFLTLVLIATALVTLRLTPIYESTATLYVDRAAAKDAVGKDSDGASASPNIDADAFLASQMKLLQSDSVVRPLAEKYRLLERELQIKPEKDDAAKIARIKAAPIVLKGLRVARAQSTYILQVSYRSQDPNIATEVANGIANSYIEHIYNIRFTSSETMSKFLSQQQDQLRANMESSAARLAALERELSVINPEDKTNILSARLLQLNTAYTKVQAERAQAQSAYNSLTSGSLESALGYSQSEELRGIMKRRNEEKQRFADIKARYGENYPEYARLQATVAELESQIAGTVQLLARQATSEFQRAQNQEALIKKDVDDTKAQYDQLNLHSFEYQRAKQDAEADRALYEELVKKIREEQINAGFKNDMVRIADLARPGSKAVFPNLTLNMSIAFLVSSLLAMAVVIIVDRVDTTIKNPEQVSHGLNARVVGVLPVFKKGSTVPDLRGLGVVHAGLASGKPRRATAFEEAISTTRNAILLTDFDRHLRSILMTSATPSEGKSLVAAHLATSHAEQNHKTLLIDGDMRRPSIHKLFHIANSSGLSKVLDHTVSWRDALIQPIAGLELYVLPAGPSNRRAADLVGQRLPQLLEEATAEFDLVFLDAPPLLGFPEPLQMAAAADGVLVVARAGQTDRTAVAAVLETLHQIRANVVGIVLNQVRKENSSSYHYYGGNYGKYYANRKGDAGETSA